MNTPPPLPPSEKPKLTWYQQLWLALPLGLLVVGGAIGGACGGAAWALNRQVFLKTRHPILRYLWTGLISLAAVFAYFFVASVFFAAFKSS